MPVNPTLVTSSKTSGFKNYLIPDIFSATIPGQNLTAGSSVSATATTTLTQLNSVVQVQVQYSGIETFWRVVPGQLTVAKPDWTVFNYEIESQISFSGNTLSVKTYMINETGGTIAIPTNTINCKAFFYVAPF